MLWKTFKLFARIATEKKRMPKILNGIKKREWLRYLLESD